MKAQTNTSLLFLMIMALLRVVTPAAAGPEDQFTKFPVNIYGGGWRLGRIIDTGGMTTLSFTDAKRMGILDENGDPELGADASQKLGGTGGGVVDCHVFHNVTFEVQPRKADGTPNGPKREVTVTVYVPKKPSLQTGANDAEKAKKTNSVTTKLGANVAGSVIEGHKFELNDEETDDPKKNKRSTGWREVTGGGNEGTGTTGGGDRKAPTQQDDNYEDEVIFEPVLPELAINGWPCFATINTAPVTCLGWQAAQQFGVQPFEMELLDFENHSALFLAGVLDQIPDEDNPLMLPVGYCDIEIPTLEGDPMFNQPVRAFIIQEGDPWRVVVGGNALVPPGTSMWLDDEQRTLVWDLDGWCKADFNGDGAVNTIDVLEFLNAWTAGAPEADINGDGQVNTLDVLMFLNDWTNGCG